MLSSLATAVVIAACWAAGAGPEAAFGSRSQLERLSVRFGAGLVLVSSGHGLLCLWSTRAAAAFVLALAGIGVALLRRPRAAALPPAEPIERRLLIAIAVLALIASLPPIAAGDSLTYHLPVVRLALEHHQLQFWPEAWRSTFPQSHEMLAVFVGELGGTRSGGIIGFEFAVMCGLVLAVARRWLGAEGRPWLALVIALGGFCPLALLGDPLKPDVLMLVAELLGILALTSSGDRPGISTAALVGIAAAGCIGAKYSALPLAALLLALFAVQYRRAGHVALAAAAALVVGGGWYARNLVLHGTPAPPFGVAPFLTPRARAVVMGVMHGFGRGRSGWAFLSGPVAMFVTPRPFSGTGNLFSPLVYVGLGALFVARLRRFAIAAVSAFVLLYTAWFFSLQNPRLLYPAVLPLAILAAGVVDRLAARGHRVLPIALAGGAVVAVCPALVVLLVSPGFYIHAGETGYLRVRSAFYDDARRIEAELPASARVLDLTGALSGPRSLSVSPYVQAVFSPEDLGLPQLADALRRQHITHVFGTMRAFEREPWAQARSQWRLLWKNPRSCACGRHLVRSGPFVETALFAVDAP